MFWGRKKPFLGRISKEPPPKLLGWRFEPETDITAYELALILREYGGSVQAMSGGLEPFREGVCPEGMGPFDRLPYHAARHFQRAEELDRPEGAP